MGRVETVHALGFQVRPTDLISFAALAVQIWELFMYITDEVEYLWRGKFNSIKSLYFVARYILLLIQIASLGVSYSVKSGGLPHIRHCKGMFVFKVFTSQLALTTVEIILFVRVYALYNQSFRVKRFLGLVFFASFALQISGTTLVAHHMTRIQTCHPPRAGKTGLILFGLGAGLSQPTILVMSLNKLVAGRRVSRTPLTSLMLREGVVAFLLVLALLVAMIFYEVLTSLDLEVGDAAYAWYIALISIGASRLILNMRKLAVKNHRQRRHLYGTYDPEFDDWPSDRYNLEEDSICLTSFHE